MKHLKPLNALIEHEIKIDSSARALVQWVQIDNIHRVLFKVKQGCDELQVGKYNCYFDCPRKARTHYDTMRMYVTSFI